MIFVKSLIAGIVAVIGYVVVVGLAFYVVAWWQTRGEGGGAGWIVGPAWPIPVGALVFFGAAFFLAFRRFSRQAVT